MENDREEPKLSNLEGVTTSSPDDDVDSLREKPRGIVPWVIALLIILGGAWFLFSDSEEGPAPATEPAPAAAPPAVAELPPAPDIPLPPPTPAPQAGMVGEEVSPPAPVLTLEDSDEAVRAALAEVGSTELVIAPLQQDDLLQRGTALIDGLSRGLLLNKILSLPRPEGKFVTQKSEGQEVIDPETYNRFDAYAQAAADLDTDSLVSAFHQFRPLLEQAYGQLGYEGADVDNALIRSLDLIIATPEIREEIPVKAKGGIYVFAEPELEALPPIQKQLLRMGPDNLMLVKQQAIALRSTLLGE